MIVCQTLHYTVKVKNSAFWSFLIFLWAENWILFIKVDQPRIVVTRFSGYLINSTGVCISRNPVSPCNSYNKISLWMLIDCYWGRSNYKALTVKKYGHTSNQNIVIQTVDKKIYLNFGHLQVICGDKWTKKYWNLR